MKTTPPSINEIVNAVTQSFSTLPTRLGGRESQKTDGEWTTQLKEDIGSLGSKHGWKICTSGFKDRFESEWLYDLIWYREDSHNHLAEVYLVLESEWEKERIEIQHDFEKLLLAKATLKVMVFQAYEQDIQELFNFLENGIRAFQMRSAGECYILIAFNIKTFEFVTKTIHV